MKRPEQKRRWLRAFLIVGGLSLLALGGVALFVFYAYRGSGEVCANDQVVETASPDGQLKAVTFRRNCGATTGYSTHVSILPADGKLANEGGNVFTASDEPSITVRWIDDRHLSISGETYTKFLHLKELRGVQITYE